MYWTTPGNTSWSSRFVAFRYVYYFLLDARRSDANSQVISPTLIVYRVSRGLGWETTTSTKLASQLLFAEDSDALDPTDNSETPAI